MKTKPRGVTAAEDEDNIVATKQARQAPHRTAHQHEKKAEQKKQGEQGRGENNEEKNADTRLFSSRHPPRYTAGPLFFFKTFWCRENINIACVKYKIS